MLIILLQAIIYWMLGPLTLVLGVVVGGSLILGTVNAFRTIVAMFIAAHLVQNPKPQDANVDTLPEQPVKLFPLDRGWSLLRYAINNVLLYTYQLIKRWIDHIGTVRYGVSVYLRLLKYPAWIVIAGLYAIVSIQYVPLVILACVFLLLYVAFLICWMATSFVAIALFTGVNVLEGKIRYPALRCPNCYLSISAPIYLCPACNTKNNPLTPGVYGIFKRRCQQCEKGLPTLGFLGRNRLSRVCPHCSFHLHSNIRGTADMYIALVGSSEAGKTAYLLAAARKIKALYEKDGSRRVSLTNLTETTSEDAFQYKRRRKQGGRAEAEMGSVTYLLEVGAQGRCTSRQVYFYDPPGEVFHDSQRVKEQAYYAYSDGLIFVIDACTLPGMHGQLRQGAPVKKDKLLALQEKATAVANIYERVMGAFEMHRGVRKRQRHALPVAVVVTRTDRVGLQDEIGGWAVNMLARNNPRITSEGAAMYWLVRRFLCAQGLDNFVRDLESHFATVRYFSSSIVEGNENTGDKSGASLASEVDPLLWLLHYGGVVKRRFYH